MKTIATIATIIATLLYILTTYLLIYDPIGRSTKPGIHLYNFFMWYTIPIILWVVYFIMKEIKKTNSKIPSFTKSNSTINTNIYYIQENGATSEALTYNQLSAKKINKNTYVWRKGIDWTRAGELKELKPLFEQNVPPPFDKDKLNNEDNDNFVARIIAFMLLLIILIFMIYKILGII